MAKRTRFRLSDQPAASAPKNKGGRPSKYNPAFVNTARVLCKHGATDDALADAFGVDTSTVRAWYSAHPEFGEAVAEGKSLVFDPLVERSLAQRAVGYSVDVEEYKIVDKVLTKVQYRKHYPPDVTACIFWLKNRQPEKWRDVYNHDHSGKVSAETLSAAELFEEIRKECAKIGLLPEQLQDLLATGVQPNFEPPTGKSKH